MQHREQKMMSFIRWGWRERDFGFEEERKQIIITGKFGKRIPDLGSRSLWMTAQRVSDVIVLLCVVVKVDDDGE